MADLSQQVIADRLKISRTTVSRCFTNHKGINPKTRAEVFSLAAQLGYQYLQPRSTKSTNQEVTLGVLVCSAVEEYYRPDYESPGFELVRGISEFAQLNACRPEIQFIPPEARCVDDTNLKKVEAFKKRTWAGLLMIYPFAPDIIGELVARFPCVSLVDQYGPVSIDCVDVNHHQGIRILMKRLLQHRKRIGFFSWKYPVEAAWSNRRLSAYVENQIRSGHHYNEKDVIVLDMGTPALMEVAYDHAAERVRDGVDAWMCAADHQAYDLIKALEARGIKVPQDVSVTGFDGILRPEGAPKLETVKIPFYEIGFSGSRRLLEKINKRFDITQEILLECRLQEGETVIPKRPKRQRVPQKTA